MTTSARLSCEQILALPPTITLAELARVLDVSEPTIRQAHRRGELEAAGIKVNRLGAQYRVITSSVWAFLGLDGASPAPSALAAPGQRDPVTHGVRFLGPCARSATKDRQPNRAQTGNRRSYR